MDKYTRERLSINLSRKLNSKDVLYRFPSLFLRRRIPGYIRSDNRLNCTALAVRVWLKQGE